MDEKMLMIQGMDKLLRKFNKYPNAKTFTVAEIITASNEVYDEIMRKEKQDVKIFKSV